MMLFSLSSSLLFVLFHFALTFLGPQSYESTSRFRRDSQLIGQTVRITYGPLKGYFGIVKDSTEQTARVELHTNCKVKCFVEGFSFEC